MEFQKLLLNWVTNFKENIFYFGGLDWTLSEKKLLLIKNKIYFSISRECLTFDNG